MRVGAIDCGTNSIRLLVADVDGPRLEEVVREMTIVRLGEGVRQVTVAQAAGMESPSLVRLLDQLCSAGYVCRSEDPNDRRAKCLSLTDSGRELVHAVESELVRLRHEVLEGISSSDLEAALRVIRAFESASHVPVLPS